MLKIILVVSFLSLLKCATYKPGQALDKIQIGMDKSMVLESAGGPQRTFHDKGKDHWIYSYFSGEHEMIRRVVFENGRVIQIASPRLRAPSDEADSADDMQELENSLRKEQKNNKGEFKDIPGQ
jgi:hypothetical protein